MLQHKTQGIIINKRVYGDADRYLTIFTPDLGKMTCFAKGVRNIKSSRIAKLDLFSHIKFEYISNRGSNTLTHVDLVSSYRKNKSELHNISRLFQIGELIDSLLPEDEPNPLIYDLLTKALDHLTTFSSGEYLTRFKLRLLRDLGYGDHTGKSEHELNTIIESLIEKKLTANKII